MTPDHTDASPGPTLDASHDISLRSWVESANDPTTDFPLQNLPFGRFRSGAGAPLRIGVAIGDQVLDLQAAGLIERQDMNALMGANVRVQRALRHALSQGLSAGSEQRQRFAPALRPQSELDMGLPCDIGDYTDFYTGIHHASAVGKLFRPDNPLLPNYKWLPIGYHGRSSSIVASGSSIRRPLGQIKGSADAPSFGPSQRLDYELELGFLIGADNALGQPIPIARAEQHLFGVALFNDWSARDIQPWEYQPLGPFLSKNFGSTLSPWIVTMQALAPFRAPLPRPIGDPDPLPYLDSPANRAHGALEIQLEVWLQTAAMRANYQAGVRLSCSNSREAAYWSAAQLVAHHTAGGCNLQSGDLLGSGTLSGPRPEQAGSLLELTQGGKSPIKLSNGESRSFLADGDQVTLRAYCERAGARRIGFGDCSGTIVAAPVIPA